MAYLSGRNSADGQQFGTYSQDDVDALRAIAEEPGLVDLFLTYPSILSRKKKLVLRFVFDALCCFLDDLVCDYSLCDCLN